MPTIGFRMPVRRDSPELILPDTGAGASTAGITPGVATTSASADTFSAWAEVCSTTEFGTNPLVVVGAALWSRVGGTITTNTTTQFQRHGIIEIGTGAAAAEVTVQELRFSQSAAGTVGGIVLDAITATLSGEVARLLPCNPLLIAASTRITYRNQLHDATVGARQTAVYGVAYNPATIAFSSNPPLHWDMHMLGADISRSEISDYLTLTLPTFDGSANVVNSAYSTINVNGGATLDADYLIEGMYASADGTVAAHKIFDIALGAAGSEVIQSRAGIPGLISIHGLTYFQFPIPFIAYAGETVRIRGRHNISSGQDYTVTLQLRRISST